MGKALNLKSRVSSYFSTKNLGEKTKSLVSQIKKIETLEVTSEIESFLLEERLIKKYRPKYNIRFTDGKTYAMLKITSTEKFPKLLITRKEENDGSIYFGPYTSSSSLKMVLKILRKIFPYETFDHHGKICLYNHLGLCTCPSVTNDKNYYKTIRYIKEFLNGKTGKLIRDLEKERKEYSNIQDYESANEINKKIEAIRLITSPFYKPFEYIENPNLRSDVIQAEMLALKNDLVLNGVKVNNLFRIECYDISNTSGKSATGSMVVFTNGEKDSSNYRRFKIKKFYNQKPNDFAMMEEMLERRFKHTEWPGPDLIILDGGKGQVTSAKKVLDKLKLNFPFIGLAKKEELIITKELKSIRLPKDSKSLHIIMRIRDEAHRFAITYHKKLRSKLIFE